MFTSHPRYAGLWTPSGFDDVEVADVITRAKPGEMLSATRLELERLEVRHEGLMTMVKEHREQILYLRKALDAALQALQLRRGETD